MLQELGSGELRAIFIDFAFSQPVDSWSIYADGER